jgi:hypothetical protein
LWLQVPQAAKRKAAARVAAVAAAKKAWLEKHGAEELVKCGWSAERYEVRNCLLSVCNPCSKLQCLCY